jgi:hypothetical protein
VIGKPANRFITTSVDLHGGKYLLIIEDYVWWCDNEREILNWMNENLPRGIEHQQGMVIALDTEQQRLHFLLRWA